ncbi:ankyrin repeat domain-containing protein [Silvibacterium sp.]|uniref:ankyrin repeat domain-containing protein n=1 Tax=Silvibacterium sp. TaxID=1964179 RepID=UPI0039E5FF5A
MPDPIKPATTKPASADSLDPPPPLHERIRNPAFRHAVALMDAGDAEALRPYLRALPDLARERIALDGPPYFRNPTLLAFIAENPIRCGTLPPNIVEIAEVLLHAGAAKDQEALSEVLALIASGRVARECSVQLPLIDLLCRHEADPDAAMLPALVHAEFEAAHALIRNGAAVDIVVAAALGQANDVPIMLTAASSEERRQALALAAQFGHTRIVALLLDAGEDPGGWNPEGTHAHSTPLHQAALAGHMEVVTLLVERGARLDRKDTLWQGTPEDWARHAGKTKIANYLRTQREHG